MSTAIRPRGPITRRFDPSTSRAAAYVVTLSGKRDAQAQIVYEALGTWPNRTSAELARLMADCGLPVDRYVVARRLPELRAGGWAVSQPPRRCLVTGHKALTWRRLRLDEQLPLHLG